MTARQDILELFDEVGRLEEGIIAIEKIKYEARVELLAEQAKKSEAFWEHLIKPTYPEVIAPYETCTYCHSTTGFHHFNCQSKRL